MADPKRPRPQGVQLDPANPEDQRIIKRQQQVARKAGREGADRAATTRGRADLEAEYDQGAAEARDEDEQDEDQGAAEESASRSVGDRAKSAARAVNRAGKPLSRGRWRPTLTPPVRPRDAGSLLAGMLLYTAVITYVRYGPAGLKGWMSAKFLNRPMVGLPPTTGKGEPV